MAKLHLLDFLWISRITFRTTNPQQIELLGFEHYHSSALDVMQRVARISLRQLRVVSFVTFVFVVTSSRGGVRNIAMSLDFCLFVCLSAIHHRIFVHVNCGRDSVLLWRRCDTLCTSGFVDDVMSSHSGPYGLSYVFSSGNRIVQQSKVLPRFKPNLAQR